MASALNFAYRMAVPAALSVAAAQQSMYDVRGGYRAVIFDRLAGVKESVVNEGTHFLVPWLQRSVLFDVRTKPRNIATTTGSKDLQMVSLTLRVLHRPEVKSLPRIYQVSRPLFPAPIHVYPVEPELTRIPRVSEQTTTSASSPPSATRSSRPSSPSSTPPSSSPSARPSPTASART